MYLWAVCFHTGAFQSKMISRLFPQWTCPLSRRTAPRALSPCLRGAPALWEEPAQPTTFASTSCTAPTPSSPTGGARRCARTAAASSTTPSSFPTGTAEAPPLHLLLCALLPPRLSYRKCLAAAFLCQPLPLCRCLRDGELFEIIIQKMVDRWSGSIEAGGWIFCLISFEFFPTTSPLQHFNLKHAPFPPFISSPIRRSDCHPARGAGVPQYHDGHRLRHLDAEVEQSFSSVVN